MSSVYEAAGGNEGLLPLAEAWHTRVMADEVVSHAFSHSFHPQHNQRLAAYWAEALGGPHTYTERYGNETAVVRIHSGHGLHEEMDQRAIACFDHALEDVGLTEEPLRQVLHDYFAWATTTTMSAYHHSADDVPQGLSIPRWSWNGLERSKPASTTGRSSPLTSPRGAHDLGENQHVSLEEIADQLYALPPDEFTGARNQAERELRKAGEQEQADEVRALHKPSAAAGAANRLVREHRPEVDAFLAAAASLRDAQFAGKGDIASAASAQRDALEKLVGLGGEPVRATLQAAAVDDNTARDLCAARLVREPEPAGFGTLLAHSEPKAAKASTAARAALRKRGASAPAAPDDRAARAQLREAKKALGAPEAEERQAKRRWAQTQRDLEKARAAVDKAQRELDRLHGR